MRYAPLYKRGKKGEIRVWECESDEDSIIVRHGVLDGKIQESRKVAQAKNIGRANERTAEVQAEEECLSLWEKQSNKGYFESVEEAKNEIVLLPMLASDFEKRKKKVEYPVDIQPKLDGVRCLAMWENGKVILLSRGGKKYNLPHISEQVSLYLMPGEIFDGEIYIHGQSLQHINSLVKKHRGKETEELQYWIYDAFRIGNLDSTWAFRKLRLHELYGQIAYTNVLSPVPIGKVESENRVYYIQGKYVSHGFEGAIVREYDAPYALGHRSNHLLKVKSFQDDEYKIVGFSHGEGKFSECVIWECETEEGKRFNVVPKGTLEEKKRFYYAGHEYIGSWLKVKFFQLTDDKIPQFPVGLAIRLSQDM